MKKNFNNASRPVRIAEFPRHSALRTLHSRAFTFIEVLFAVVILGVGLIMIAGMLPVAIKQNADTRNDLTAKVVCDSGYAYIRTLIQQHPEAFPETCGDRGTDPPLSVKSVYSGKPFLPRGGSMLEQFMGNQLMNLNNADDYTPAGSSPAFPNSLFQNGGDINRYTFGLLRAGRMMPLSYDVARPSAANNYNLGTMTAANLAAYPLAWHQLELGDRIVSSEPRFQWLAFYRRDEGSRVIKLVIVAMRLQAGDVTDRYRAVNDAGPDGVHGTADDVQNATLPHEGIGDPAGANPVSSNGPFLVPVEIEDSLTEPDKVKFVGSTNPSNYTAWDTNVAETGSFLIIAHSPPLSGPGIIGTPPTATVNDVGDMNRPFRNNGKIFRLAARREDLDTKVNGGGRVWELAPGFDLNPADAGPDQIVGTPDDVPDGSMNTQQSFDDNLTAPRNDEVKGYPVIDTSTFVDGTRAYAWIIGRGHLDPTYVTDPTGSAYVGPTQDLGILSVDVPLP